VPSVSSYSRDFPLDAGIFTTAKLALGASTEANATRAILANHPFPDGNVDLGRISLTASTGEVSLRPATAGGASVRFDIAASTGGGAGVFGTALDAIGALNLADPPLLKIADADGQRYLLMKWGYSASFSGEGSHPVGMLGTVRFGVDAKQSSLFAVLHRFDASRGAHSVIEDSLASWRLPRHVAYDGHDVNLKPGTWLLAEADGSLALKLAASLGWNMAFARDASLLGVTRDLSVRIDASLNATFGFNVSGRYILVVGRESAEPVVRLRLCKQSTKGLGLGFNLNVGAQAAASGLPRDFDGFIKTTFGVHGLQVVNDLRQWTDPSTTLGQKLAGLADQTVLDLLRTTTGLDPAVEFDKAKRVVADALNKWTTLPARVSSMVWTYLERQAGPDGHVAEFRTFLSDLANPAAGAAALAKALQQATFGDTPQGQFLEAIAERGLLSLANDLGPVSTVAGQVLDILDGGIVAKLQAFIDQRLNLAQIRNAVSDADFLKADAWLKNRLAGFLDRTLVLDDLKDVQRAIRTLDTKIGGYYETAVQTLTRRYRVDFAATYQETSTGTALIDVDFDLSTPDAAKRFDEVVAQSNLDNLLTRETAGVRLHRATLTHQIRRKGTVDLNMPFFDFSSTSVNDAMVTLTAEELGGRLLLYQIDASDHVTVANRAASQLSVLASITAQVGRTPALDEGGAIAYEMRQVKAGMRPLDLEARTGAFIRQYLGGLFTGGEASIRDFYADLDHAVSAATGNQGTHLGDIAVSMEVSIEAAALRGWFQARSSRQLRVDQMRLSRALQASWRNLLPALFFQDPSQYQFNEPVAALLVWSSLPISTSIGWDEPAIRQFNTDDEVYWDWPDVDMRRAVARDSHTISALAGRVAGIQGRLLASGSRDATLFAPAMAGRLVDMALNATGDAFLSSLLFTEAQLVNGATTALKKISAALANAATAPTHAIKTLSDAVADLTATFNQRVSSNYSGMSGRVVGPMLLVESSAALAAPASKPAALLTLYALTPGHAFDLASFLDGTMPPQPEVALTQTLVSLR
jgi:hypothetical protein